MIYVALELGEFAVAVFWDRNAAEQFCLRENNMLQVEYMEVEEFPLIDMYGFPCSMKDIPTIYPWLAQAPKGY